MALKQKEELKKLQSLIVKQKSKIDLIKRERQLTDERLAVAERNLKKIEEEMKKLKNGNKIIVSEHAILRYLFLLHNVLLLIVSEHAILRYLFKLHNVLLLLFKM